MHFLGDFILSLWYFVSWVQKVKVLKFEPNSFFPKSLVSVFQHNILTFLLFAFIIFFNLLWFSYRLDNLNQTFRTTYVHIFSFLFSAPQELEEYNEDFKSGSQNRLKLRPKRPVNKMYWWGQNMAEDDEKNIL